MDLINERKHKRIPVRFKTEIQRAALPTLGFLTNLSEGGMCILASEELKSGDKLELDIHSDLCGVVKVAGSVLWSRSLKIDLVQVNLFESGVKLLAPPPEYLELVRSVAHAFVDRRVHPRFRSVLQVRVEELISDVDLFTVNISKGGVFVQSEKLPSRDEVVELLIRLPGSGAATLRLEGVVLDTCDASRARREMRVPGFSLRYTRFREGDDLKLFLYLDHLQKQALSA